MKRVIWRTSAVALGLAAWGCGGTIDGLSSSLTSNDPYTLNATCLNDADMPAPCTFWTCQNVPDPFAAKTHCDATQPMGGPSQPSGPYTCPDTGGGTFCPAPGAGGSGPWTCVATTTTLSCDRQGGGGGMNDCMTTGTGVCTGSLPPAQGGCWITGGGFVVDADGNDSFGGNGMPMKDGTIRGEWEHQDHGTGDKLHGQVRYLVCRHVDEPGPGQPSGPSHNFNINQAYYGGPGRWFTPAAGWADGYWFDIMIEDHGEPGNKAGPGNHGSMGPDEYYFTARTMAGNGQSGTVVYTTGGPLVGGNLQIHPPNNGHPYTVGTLPSWVSLQP